MSHKVFPIERIMACLCYVTLGWAGALILIAQALFKMQPTRFITYHVFQSIFFFFTLHVVSMLAGLVVMLIAPIPVLNNIPILLNAAIPMFGGLSIIEALLWTVVIYLVFTSLLGKYSFLPWFSKIVAYWVK